MAGIRGKNTRPEMIVRRGIHRLGFRYRLHVTGLPAKPDLVFPARRAVIFIHGCFWHGHGCELFKWPSTRRSFWRNKISSTRKRDAKAILDLQKDEWRTLVVWECSLKGPARKDPERVIYEVAEWLNGQAAHMEIAGS